MSNIQHYQNYAKHISANSYIFNWVNTTLKNYLNKNQAKVDPSAVDNYPTWL